MIFLTLKLLGRGFKHPFITPLNGAKVGANSRGINSFSHQHHEANTRNLIQFDFLVGESAGYRCQACRVSPQQINIQRQSEVLGKENLRKHFHNLAMPPVFAMVPPYTSTGKIKLF